MGVFETNLDSSAGWFWLIFGLSGMLIFGGRFVIQWLASEKRKESVIPVSFWYLSIIGSIILFVYALAYKRDLVFTLSYTFNGLIYARNLYFIHRRKKSEARSPAGD